VVAKRKKEARSEAVRSLIGGRIQQLRKHRGFSQAELAERAGLDVNFLGGVERGERNPSVATLVHVADALDIELAAVVDLRESDDTDTIRRELTERLRRMERPQLLTLIRMLNALDL
jgi:transcriptional regulator with XRE-family HTH domain